MNKSKFAIESDHFFKVLEGFSKSGQVVLQNIQKEFELGFSLTQKAVLATGAIGSQLVKETSIEKTSELLATNALGTMSHWFEHFESLSKIRAELNKELLTLTERVSCDVQTICTKQINKLVTAN